MPTPRLSVIVVVYNMSRAAPRTLRSLAPDYQVGMSAEDYEIILVDNGSPQPLREEQVTSLAPNVRYLPLDNPPPSPAYAINRAAAEARGEVIALMVDGAHMLTPGVLQRGRSLFDAMTNPLVVTAAA